MMDLEHVAGFVIIMGSLLFDFAALPIGGKVYSGSDADENLRIIAANQTGWLLSQLMFFAGGLITPIGFYLWSIHRHDQPNVRFVQFAAVLMAVGFVGWAVYVVQRAFDPPAAYKYSKPVKAGLIGYLLLTEIALVLLGVGCLRGGFSGWLGYGLIGLAALFALAAIIFGGGFPPFLFYVPTLVVGIVLLFY